jgi:hypothetical protein
MNEIFNIMIVAAVVLFVLRRMQEVAQKGKDITGIPLPQTMVGDERRTQPSRRAESFDEPETPHRRFGIPETPPPPRPFHGEPASQRRFDIPLAAPAPRRPVAPPRLVSRLRRRELPHQEHDERFFETHDTEESGFREPAGEPQMRAGNVADPDMAGRMAFLKRNRVLRGNLYSRGGLVQGMIMREVLGPPVALQDQR